VTSRLGDLDEDTVMIGAGPLTLDPDWSQARLTPPQLLRQLVD